jgi:hypothetical protein
MSLEYLKILSLGGGYLNAGDHGSRARHGGFPERDLGTAHCFLSASAFDHYPFLTRQNFSD